VGSAPEQFVSIQHQPLGVGIQVLQVLDHAGGLAAVVLETDGNLSVLHREPPNAPL
jgi:hypothetical protein